MKKYIIDRLIFLLAGIGIMIGIPFFCGSIFTIFFETMTVLAWIGLCWRMIILPLDLLCGKEEKTVYFSRQQQIEKYEFFKKYCFEWAFHYDGNKKITLLVPISVKKEEIASIQCPKKDVPVKITYYRFSKILIDWDQIST